jgi:dTDP-4-amino-4,6-dideoxygalactose transaminase
MLRLSKSCISDAEKKAVLSVLDNEFLGMGPKVKEFEDKLSSFFGRPVMCVTNGTAALHLSLQACGIGKGDEVLVPSLTYIASFQAITATGAKPIACDIESRNFLLNISDAEKRITSKTKAIMPVHYTGGVGRLDSVFKFARQYNLRVIEDAAHAFGTTYKNKLVGSFGDISCFSFDGIKNITSGEGGCIVTKDKKVINKVKDSRLLGVEKDTDKRYRKERSWSFDVKNQGWRYHMSDIMAAIGLEQLNRFSEFAKKRRKLAKKYDDLLIQNKNIKLIPRDYKSVVPHIYVVRIIGLKNRELIIKNLNQKGIQVGYHYHPNHWLSYFKDKQNIKNPLKVTDEVYHELLSLPLHPDLSEKNVSYIVKELIKVIERNEVK